MSYEWEDESEEEIDSDGGGGGPAPQSGLGKDIANNLARKAQQAVKTKARQASVKAAKATGKAIAKLAAVAAKALLAALPYIWIPLLCIGAFSLLFSWLYQYDVEERPLYQNYQTESGKYDNNYAGGGVESMSPENLVELAFYISYAQQSYFKSFDGEVIRASVATSDKENSDEVWDKYNRESTFYLSENFLWAMDKYLHGREYRYPEAFLRPLYMDMDNFEVLDLTDEEGNILVTSKGYDENGNRTDEDVPGVWDYGLAPVLNYEEYIEKAKIIYKPKKKQVVIDTNGDGKPDTVQWVDVLSDKDGDVKQHEVHNVAGFPRTVHLIDKVATFLGVIENTIVQDWTTTGMVGDKTEVYNDKASIWVEVEVTYEEPVYKNGEEVWVLEGKVNGKKVKLENVKSYFHKSTNKVYMVGKGDEVGDKTTYTFDSTPKFYQKIETKTRMEWVEEKTSLLATYSGEQMEYIPRYDGDADFSNFKGSKYLMDYITLYEAYIPENIRGDFDLSERVQANEEEIREMIEQYEMNYKAGMTGGTFTGSQVGQMSGTAFQNAYSPVYEPYFAEFAAAYGVDARLLKAMAAQESGGNHDNYLTYERCSTAGCGLMQIEKPGNVIKTMTAYNFIDKKEETVSVCYPGQKDSPTVGCLDVTNIANNIKVGAMQLASRLKAWEYNIPMALQSYNYGVGGMNTVLKIYEQQEGVSKQVAIANPQNLGWMKYRINVHLNPSLLGSAYASWKSYGDDVYVEHVLRYFPSAETIEVVNPSTGQSVYFKPSEVGIDGADTSALGNANTSSSGVLEGSSSGGLVSNIVSGITNAVQKTVNQVGNFIKSSFDKIFSFGTNWFEKEIELDPPKKNATYYKQPLSETEKDILVSTIIAMDEGVQVSDVGTIDDSFWLSKAETFFMNPYGDRLGLNESEQKSSDPYFNGEAISPLKTGTTTVVAGFDAATHQEIDLAAPVGTGVVAIYDGVVKEIANLGGDYGYTVIVSHPNGMESYYTNLDKDTIKVSRGDELNKGDDIGLIGEANNNGTQVMHFKLKKGGMFVDGELILNPTMVGGTSSFVPPLASGMFIIPLPTGYVSCDWDCYEGHKGIDFGNNGDTSTPIIASATGVVTRSGWHEAFGWHVILKHNIDGQEYHTLYAHMHQRPMVSDGQTVQQGQQLGFMGNTGNSFGAHLHFQIHEGAYATSTRVNPRKYLDLPPENVRYN